MAIVKDRFAIRIGQSDCEDGALAGTKAPDKHAWWGRRRMDDLQPRRALNLLKDRIGRAPCAYFGEHGVGNNDFGYSGAEQLELPDLGQKDQGRGVDDSADWRCHDSSSSFSSSIVTWLAGTFARNKASRKSARLNPAISAALPWEIKVCWYH
jgi:hypothetical protein